LALYGIGEVEAVLGVPASTIRYWERALPLLAARKGISGRRVYSEADLRLLLRFKHLCVDCNLGIAAAGEAILAELGSRNGEVFARIAELKGELLELYFESERSGRLLHK
jgi:DNA-binding transcriptional MerR regulator